MEKRFGTALRQARKAAKLRLKDMSGHLGIKVSYLSDVELGRRAPFTRDRILLAAEIAKLDPHVLLTAAAETKGAFELDANVRPKAKKVGAALMRGWRDLPDEKLDAIAHILVDVSFPDDD